MKVRSGLRSPYAVDTRSNEEWLADQRKAERKTDRFIVIALCVGFILLGALGVGGVLLVKWAIGLALRAVVS